MTTFNGFIRSTNAAINRMERVHNQRERRLAKIEKVRRKEEMLANAAIAVQHYNQLKLII